ncbi:ROST-like protein [Mya arenaria]|uniref:ROST-like protein n=1 Tax=Mya arenaria TaxID=6604 RepID=A0ABY7G105_MYAAR|nr:protein rolling stone-like [Mya arenaria]WAR26746.1 ROST-like protein [Mya arenaria]
MSNSPCCAYVRREFQLKYLGFADVHPHRFCFWQWRVPPLAVLVYRFILAAYTVFWIIYSSSFGSIVINDVKVSMYAFLTTWTYLVLTVYLVLHFLLSLFYICKHPRRLCSRLSSENHRRLFHELHVQPSLWTSSQEYDYVPGAEESQDVEFINNVTPGFFAKIVWILYNIASCASILVTIIFWSLLFPYMKLDGFELMLNVQLHAITSVIVLIENVISAVPIRLPHMFYTVLYGVAYLIFAGVYYAVDHRHILYPHVLDFSDPKSTAIVVTVTVLVILPLIQLFLFCLYKLRTWIFDKCCPEEL